jgi:sialate O-acetylesterase
MGVLAKEVGMAMRRGLAAGVVAGVLATGAVARADVTPAALFTDHMVLQQGMAIPVWGRADAGERVTVTLGGQSASATAGEDGKWLVRLPAQQAGGGALELTIAGKNTVTVKDVLVGEVWLASGQSNMAFTVSKAKASYAGLVNEAEVIAAATYPQIRMFTVADAKTYEPQGTLKGDWQVCSPETVPGFSAVGYLFARDLHKALNVPVGIVRAAFGASTAEAWMSREAAAGDAQLKPMLDRFDAAVTFYRENPQATADAAPKPPRTINARPAAAGGRQRDPVQDQHQPTVLFNGMLNPVIPYAVKGAIWYQGESIVGGDAGVTLYPHVQAVMIRDWRRRWGQGDFPFYLVQLPGLQNVSNNPRVREGQAEVLSLVPNTAMAVTIDIGDPKDVHPHNKEPLGDRLTRIALAHAYGRVMEWSGPTFEGMEVKGNAAVVTFGHAGSGLVAKGGPLKWFQVAGADQKFVNATAVIEGGAVVVSSPEVERPVAVRYAWDNYPDGANLYNGAGLPAAPFRTDRWGYPLAGIVE